MQAIRIFLVDDEPSSRSITALHLADTNGYEVLEFENGEACLESIDANPGIILMDVEMPGMGGIDTCRQIRDLGNNRSQIIFVSSHNDLETRLKAYDAGGTDYIVKPFSVAELKQKIRVASKWLTEHDTFSNNFFHAQKTAFTAMSSMGELGVALRFVESSFSCIDQDELAEKIMECMRDFGLQAIAELRIQQNKYFYSSGNEITPLEQSILQHANQFDRIFQFGRRLAINHLHITLVITNIPVEDSDRAGRIRDHLCIICEAADARTEALEVQREKHQQSNLVSRAVADLSEGIRLIETRQQDHRFRSLQLMDEFVIKMERAFLHIGLSERHEIELITLVEGLKKNVSELMDESKGLGEHLEKVSYQLKMLSNLS